MWYAVDTEALRDGADSVEEALSRLVKLGLADDLSRVRAALPGGRAASSARQVCLAWQTRLSETRWAMKGLGCDLSAAAESYDAVESVAQSALGGLRGVSSPAHGLP